MWFARRSTLNRVSPISAPRGKRRRRCGLRDAARSTGSPRSRLGGASGGVGVVCATQHAQRVSPISQKPNVTIQGKLLFRRPFKPRVCSLPLSTLAPVRRAWVGGDRAVRCTVLQQFCLVVPIGRKISSTASQLRPPSCVCVFCIRRTWWSRSTRRHPRGRCTGTARSSAA